ncbi:MAG: hypothetical protein ABEJ95_06715 [Candidatus Nanohalobium sp.]
MANYKEQYPNLYHINSSLAKTKELSEHNKEVLDEYFDRWRSRTDSASNSGFASRWSTIAPHIDFKIDEASRDIGHYSPRTQS